MLLRSDLTLRRITTCQFDSILHRSPKPFCITNLHKMGKNNSVDVGAGKPTTTTTSNIAKDEEKKAEEEKKSVVIPPPPEKPLPGDCCGSGCVRCVWDVYYEELEEYNKLYNPNSKSSS